MELNFSKELRVSKAALNIAKVNKYFIEFCKFPITMQDQCKSRIVKIGAVQSSIVASTKAPVDVQRHEIFNKVEEIIEAAAAENVNILCLPEMWSESNVAN